MSSLRAAMNTSPDRWTPAQLAGLHAAELAILCRLLGVPHSGTKPQQIARLLDLGDLRGILATYDHPDAMTPFFSGATLRALCKRAGICAPSTKYGLAASLINWRNECRHKGQQFYAELRATRAQLPCQLRLPLDE
jgi:hypothetical protein